jgi:hypothetical protein
VDRIGEMVISAEGDFVQSPNVTDTFWSSSKIVILYGLEVIVES